MHLDRPTTTAAMPHRGRHDRSRLTGAAAAVLLGLAAAALPWTAEARILPGTGVAGVKLGDTTDSVRAALGAPEPGSTVLNYRYIRSRGFGVYFIAGRVFEITVVRRPEATPRGIRVGSSLRALRAAHPRVACRPAAVATALDCSLRSSLAGRATETSFRVNRTTVSRIAVRFA